jgi:hypothetical protein
MPLQVLTLTLDGITAGDYMVWLYDPEPPALGRDLRAVTVRGEPLGETVEAVLSWQGAPPAPSTAAPMAGLALTPEVIAVQARELAAAA